MTKNVITVRENETIKNLFKLMDKHGILGVPVVDSKKVVIGMVTESDLIKHFTTIKSPRGINLLGSIIFLDNIADFNKNLKDHCAELVKDIMIDKVTCVEGDATLLEAIDIMAEYDITRLPVTDKGNKLIGIITRSDIVHQIAKLNKI